MDFLEIIILLAITFGGSIIKFVSEKKKKQVIDSESNPAQEEEEDDEMKWIEFLEAKGKKDDDYEEIFGEASEESFDEISENENDDFLPKAETSPAETPTNEKFSARSEGSSSLQNRSPLSSSFQQVQKDEDEISDFIDENEENNILSDLSNADELKKAVIYQEILKPKF
ncbi:MAG: hypothetical protein IJ280_05255 [Bacteroidales bacterium]|nr:hypothetical protein [Bacteroidales bacterium]